MTIKLAPSVKEKFSVLKNFDFCINTDTYIIVKYISYVVLFLTQSKNLNMLMFYRYLS